MTHGPTLIELRSIETALEMSGGYVLDFTDRSFSDFFSEYGVIINDSRYAAEGASKAKRLRFFLKVTPAPLSGRVLAGLLEHRLVMKSDGLSQTDITAYCQTVKRLGGIPPVAAQHKAAAPIETEADLLRRVFDEALFKNLPLDGAMIPVLLERMHEATRCIEVKAYLASVIICGSVLEGMCLGFGTNNVERVNRAYGAHYKKGAPKLQDWKLREWIDVLGKLGDLSPNIEKFGQALRDFRNYVHPAEQLANRFTPDHHTARIGFQVVVAAAEDLVRGGSSIAAARAAESTSGGA
jgi:hypothetical protein